MFIVAVDVGNHATKLGVFSQSEIKGLILIWTHAITEQSNSDWQQWVSAGIDAFLPDAASLDQEIDDRVLQPTVRWSICSVNPHRTDQLIEVLKENRPHDHIHLILPQHVPLASKVENRNRLGRDRLVAAWQGYQMADNQGVVVVDAGTAVTIDFVDSQGLHHGGIIYPGADLMFESLNRHTASLPDLKGDHRCDNLPIEQLGINTEQAIHQGVISTQVSTINAAVEFISRATSEPPLVILTGGGAEPLIRHLPSTYQHVPDLVLRGTDALGRVASRIA